jgi:indole-3-glycerol phosphate synthase
MDFLSEITAKKRWRVEAAREAVSPDRIRAQGIEGRLKARRHALVNALTVNAGFSLVAEFKRRSPSRGMIRVDASPAIIARSYEHGGAAAISVLTEEDYFGGSLDDLRAVRATVQLPILRKDFILDEYQVYEAAAAGADALLLIVAALNDDSLTHLRAITEDELGMDALVEVHTKEEMRRATSCGAKLIGVNNRDLRTFDVSLETSVALAREAPAGAVLISESGLNTADDLRSLYKLGYKGFLIGESLMHAKRPDIALRALLAECKKG